MKKIGMSCPNGHGKMVIKKEKRKMTFRGVNIIVPTNQYTCKVCGIEAGTVKQAADLQKAILEAYCEDKNKKELPSDRN